MKFINPDYKTIAIVFFSIIVLLLVKDQMPDIVNKMASDITLLEKSHAKERELLGTLMFRMGQKNIMNNIFNQLNQTAQVRINLDEDDFIILKPIIRE